MAHKFLIILLMVCCAWHQVSAQDTKKQMAGKSLLDTTRVKPAVPAPQPANIKITDTNGVVLAPKKEPHDPNKATVRSAMIPGWGQAYNREYWKIPLVYGALAIPTATFFFNNSYYKKTKFAYDALYRSVNYQDNSLLGKIDKSVLKSDGTPYELAAYQSSRNFYRRNRDYSVLWFLILWGVNVVDATVFGHLQTFDVSDDLSMDVKPTFNTANNAPGVGLVVSLKKPTHTLKPLPDVK